MPIYDSTLDYIFETDIMVEHGWDYPLRVRRRAQKEYLELRKKCKDFIDDAERLKEHLIKSELHGGRGYPDIIEQHNALVQKYGENNDNIK